MTTVSRQDRDGWLMADDVELSVICRLDFHKASGNGGQKVNKTSSAARVTHLPTGLTVSSAESRSQFDNRKYALRRLRLAIAYAFREKPDPDFSVGEPPVSMKNVLYPLWIANILDIFESVEWELKSVAEKLHLGTSKTVKLIYRDPVLWTFVQGQRQKRELPALRKP